MNAALLAAAAGAGFAAGWAVRALRARRLERLRARLLSFVAHEVNTPLTPMNLTLLSFMEGLYGPISAEQRPWLVLLREQTARLTCLIGDLRDLVHLEFHKDLRVHPEPVDLREVFERAVAGMREALARSSAEVVWDFPEGPLQVLADPDRIGRITAAVLIHARKFRSEAPITLSARREGSGGPVVAEVRFRCKGADPVRARESLSLYYPALHEGSEVLAATGTGLGLQAGLVSAQGGSMDFTVENGGDCRVLIRLPGVNE